jgi:type IV secretory pathway TrbD component
MERQYYLSGRGEVDWIILLLTTALAILGVSVAVWPELRFGGPVWLFAIMTMYSRRDPQAQASFLHWFTFSRRLLPVVHFAVLFLFQSNYLLALAGCAVGLLIHAVQTMTPVGKVRLPEFLYSLGPMVGLGDDNVGWRGQRNTGVRLGGGL